MDHREAKSLLLDYVAGDLDQKSRSAMTSHIEECVDCRAWLETHDLLAIASEVNSIGNHPDSELLSVCAVRPADDYEPGMIEVREHLETCESCRREMELVHRAVLNSRPEGERLARDRHSIRSYSWWHVAAAACVVAVAFKVLLPVGMRHPGAVGFEPNETSVTMDEMLRLHPGSSEVWISEEEIAGIRLIEADESLTLSQVKIREGARVTIRSGDVVAFGNGFQVGPGARLTVMGSVGNSIQE